MSVNFYTFPNVDDVGVSAWCSGMSIERAGVGWRGGALLFSELSWNCWQCCRCWLPAATSCQLPRLQSADRSCGRGAAAAEEGCRVFACGPRQFVRQQRGLGTSYYSHPRLCVCWSHAAWLWSYLLQWKLLTLQLPSCKLGTSQQLPTLPLLHLCPV